MAHTKFEDLDWHNFAGTLVTALVSVTIAKKTMVSYMDPKCLRNPDLFARMAAPLLAAEPVRGDDGKWRWGGINSLNKETRLKLATSTQAIPRRASLVHHRRYSGVDMDPAAREKLRMNRHQVAYMQSERSEMLLLAAMHRRERENKKMREEEELAIQLKRQEQKEEEERQKQKKIEEDERTQAYASRRAARPDAYKKIYKSLITKTYAGEKDTTNFQNTTTNWTPTSVPVKQSQESPGISRTHGRTTSDYSDVQFALRRMNR